LREKIIGIWDAEIEDYHLDDFKEKFVDAILNLQEIKLALEAMTSNIRCPNCDHTANIMEYIWEPGGIK
jgi:hypothetical protein